MRQNPSTIVPPLLIAAAMLWSSAAIGQEFSKNDEKIKPVPVESGAVVVNPTTTQIEFIGLHKGANPNPRLGGFSKYEGSLAIEDDKLAGITVGINVDSLWTQVGDMLTNHLNAADFLNTKEHPTAKFQSTKIEEGEDGKYKITGKLTLMGQSKEITFPAQVKITEDGLVLTSEFDLDRTLFGMSGHADNVEEGVKMSVVVGQPSTRGAKKTDDTQASTAAPRAAVSGLKVGEEVSPWEPVHVAGPDKGTKTCPICTYMKQPAVVAFAKPGAKTDKLLAELEKLLAAHKSEKLKGFVAIVDTPPMLVSAMASMSDLELTSLCYLAPETREKVLTAYKVDTSLDNTVIVYKDYKVVANFNDLDVAKDPKALVQAVEAMLQ